MFAMKDSDYKCTLSGATLEKAQKELKEDPSTRAFEVNTLRKRIEKVPGLKARTDINFLLPFLRVRKFDQEKAYQQVKSYYSWKREKAEVFDDLKPSRIQLMLDANMMEVLKHRDNMGCRVVIWRAGNWDEQRFPPQECLKLYSVVMLKLQQEEETQVNGIHFIADLGKMTMSQGMTMTPSISKFYIHMLQSILPIRLKRIDYVKEPTFFDAIFQIFKQFMNEKLIKRVCMNGQDMTKENGLYSSIDPDLLPTDFGGKIEPFSNTEWKQGIMSSEKEFEEDNKYGYVDMTVSSDRKDKDKADAGLSGLGGTFKKLDI